MATFIKPGFWEKRSLAPKHWLNLDQLITSLTGSKYKVYTALLSQDLGGPVTINVLENSIGNITINPLGGGEYNIVSDSKFISTTVLLYNPGAIVLSSTSSIISSRYIVSNTSNILFGTYEDGQLSDNTMANSLIEIRVYS